MIKQFNSEEIKKWDKTKRLRLINSITGIKPGNVIGTQSEDGVNNLAVISSVVHLGSNPPYIGFILRPNTVRRDTYNNILATKQYTINAIQTSWAKNAHYTSAKFDANTSEFEKCGLTPKELPNFKAPFVLESPLKYGLQLQEVVEIKTNNTIMIVGEIQHALIEEEGITPEFDIQLDKLNLAGVSGLNNYYKLDQIASFPYVRLDEFPSDLKND